MTEVSIKLTGAAVVIISSVFYGLCKVKEVRSSIRNMSAFFDLIKYIKDNIEHFVKPVPSILNSYSHHYLEEIGFLREARENGIYRAWKNIETGFSEECREVLHEFFSALGRGYLEDELNRCEYTLKRLGSILESEKNSSKSKEKIYKTIPLMLAVSVVLILV